MTAPTTAPHPNGTTVVAQEAPESASEITRYWWLWLVVGVAWIAASLVVLQFDAASITTIGVIVGVMFTFAGIQQFAIAAIAERYRWLWAFFGVLFVAAGVICFINPEATFVGLADTLGFLFLIVGVAWTVRALIERATSTTWWLGLTAGVLMIILAFWTGGQFFIEKAYTLLVFAGIWAMMQGITDILRAFEVRSLRKVL